MNLADVKLQAGYEGSSIGDLVFSWLSVYHDHEWERLRDLMEKAIVDHQSSERVLCIECFHVESSLCACC